MITIVEAVAAIIPIARTISNGNSGACEEAAVLVGESDEGLVVGVFVGVVVGFDELELPVVGVGFEFVAGVGVAVGLLFDGPTVIVALMTLQGMETGGAVLVEIWLGSGKGCSVEG